MLVAVSRMDLVCLSWGQVWCWLSCGDEFVGYVLMLAFKRRITCGGVGKERKAGLLFGAVSCWILLWEPACEHFMNYAKVRGF